MVAGGAGHVAGQDWVGGGGGCAPEEQRSSEAGTRARPAGFHPIELSLYSPAH